MPYLAMTAVSFFPMRAIAACCAGNFKVKRAAVAASRKSIAASASFSTTELQDSVLYVLESENEADAAIDLRDAATAARLTLKLPAPHAALGLIGKKEKAVIAKYGI